MIRIFAVSVYLLFTISALAQDSLKNKLSFAFGTSMPLFSYSSKKGNTTDGYAKQGVASSIEYIRFTQKNFGINFKASHCLNKLNNSSIADNEKAFIENQTGIGTYSEVESKAWQNITMMVGATYKYHICKNFGIDANADIGLSLLITPKIRKAVYDKSVVLQTEVASSKSIGMGYNAGIRFHYLIVDNTELFLSANYFHLENEGDNLKVIQRGNGDIKYRTKSFKQSVDYLSVLFGISTNF